MKSRKASPPKIPFVVGAPLVALLLVFTAANCFADTDIVYTYDSNAGKDYSALGTWEADTDVVLTSANTKVFTISNLTGVADFPHNTSVENSDATHTGTTIGVPTQGDQIMITTTNLSNERVYMVGDHTKYFDVDAGDQVGVVYLDCYDGGHDDYVDLAGATTDSSHYRCIRSASDCTKPFAGTKETGAYFETTHNDDIFTLTENYCRIEHIGGKLTSTAATANTRVFDVFGIHCKVIDCVMYDSSSTGTGVVHGIRMQGDNGLVVNSIAHDNTGDGFRLSADTGESNYAYNCTAVDNDMFGFDERTAGSNYVWNCVGDNNGDGVTYHDFDTMSGGFASGSNYNMSKDTTAPGTNSKTSKSFTNMWASETSGSEDYHLSATGQADSDFQGGADPAGALNPPNYTLTDDIDEQPRETWYRGADEYDSKVYVWASSPDPRSPYIAGWDHAAHNIQDAVDVASSGNIVTVRDGTYSESITMADGVDVVNRAGDTPIISSTTADTATVTFSGPINCDLDGFTINHPSATGDGISLDGTSDTVTTTISNCTIHDIADGEGIRMNGVVNCTITGNVIKDCGNAGISVGDVNQSSDNVQGGSSITIKGNTIGDSTDPNGGAGIYIKGSGSVTVVIGGAGADKNTIYYNAEAGIRLDTITNLTIDNDTINNNTYAGILLIDVGSASGDAIIQNNAISSNSKAGINIGGASYLTIGDNNTVSDNYAGVVFNMTGVTDSPGTPSSGPVTITGNYIYSNNTKAGIAVIDNVTGTITIDDNEIYQNTKAGIGIFNKCTAVITDNEIYNHSVAAGIFTGDWSGTPPPSGTGFDRTNGPATLTIKRNKAYGNRAGIRVDHASGIINNNLVYGAPRGGIRFSGNNVSPYAPFSASWGITEIKNNTAADNGSYVTEFSEDRGGGIVYDAINITADPITLNPRNFFDRPVGATQNPITIKNNIVANNKKAGVKFCADNSSDDRSHNLFYRNFEGTCDTGDKNVDCGRMCRCKTLGNCYAPGINCCDDGTGTWCGGWVWATGEICGEDPLFNADYTLQAGSPAIGAGSDNNDMGAYGGTDPITW